MGTRKRNGPDTRRMQMLADRLAVALCYLSAIDDAVDPFAATVDDAGWTIALLAAKARTEIGGSITACVMESETNLLIQGAKQQADIGLRDTPLYDECLGRVRQLVRRCDRGHESQHTKNVESDRTEDS